MRIERTGIVEPMTPRVERFIKEALGGLSLDDVQAPNDRRADYLCLRGLLAIELKSLEDPGDERMENLFEELRKRQDWPIFLGSAPIDSFIKNTSDPEGVNKAVIERVSRGLLNPLKKANRQLEAHSASFPRRNQVRVLLLVNEDHEIYEPHTVSYVLWHAVRRKDGKRLRYENVDAVLYLTERHATAVAGKIAFPIVLIESPARAEALWKYDVANLIASRWNSWNSADQVEMAPDISEFGIIDHIPDVAPRHDRWRTEYRRNPTMRTMTREELRDRFDEVSLLSTVSMLKDTPLNLPMDQYMVVMEQFTHLMLEMGDRAIPATEFDHDADRTIAAARRLGLAPNVIEWISAFENELKARNGA